MLTATVLVGLAVACDDQALRSGVATVESAFRNAFALPDSRPNAVAASEAGLELAARGLRCLEAPVPPALAARYHAAHALLAWLDDDRPRAVASLRAMVAADPDYRFDPTVVPAEHDLHALRWLAEERPGAWDRAYGRWVLVDGLPARRAPSDHPYVLQRLGGSGPLKGVRVDPSPRGEGEIGPATGG